MKIGGDMSVGEKAFSYLDRAKSYCSGILVEAKSRMSPELMEKSKKVAQIVLVVYSLAHHLFIVAASLTGTLYFREKSLAFYQDVQAHWDKQNTLSKCIHLYAAIFLPCLSVLGAVALGMCAGTRFLDSAFSVSSLSEVDSKEGQKSI